jgi:hypothetical protein
MSLKQNSIKLSLGTTICLTSVALMSSAFATPGGDPQVLDTQTGIHDGVGGTILETGPLTDHRMVQAPSVAGAPQEVQPVIEVSPYVGMRPGGQGGGRLSGAPSSSHRRVTPSQTGSTSVTTAISPHISATPVTTAMPSRTGTTPVTTAMPPHMGTTSVTTSALPHTGTTSITTATPTSRPSRSTGSNITYGTITTQAQ